MTDDSSEHILENIAQVTPALTVSSAVFFGLPLSDWVYVVTIVYTFVGICTMIKKHWIEPWLAQRRQDKNEL